MSGRDTHRVNAERLYGTKEFTLVNFDATVTSYKVKQGDNVLRIGPASLGGTLELPSMGEAVGRFYTVTSGSAGSIDIVDDETATTLTTLAVAGAQVVLFCTGFHWNTVNMTQVLP